LPFVASRSSNYRARIAQHFSPKLARATYHSQSKISASCKIAGLSSISFPPLLKILHEGAGLHQLVNILAGIRMRFTFVKLYPLDLPNSSTPILEKYHFIIKMADGKGNIFTGLNFSVILNLKKNGPFLMGTLDGPFFIFYFFLWNHGMIR
jgi:hypothetical protein